MFPKEYEEGREARFDGRPKTDNPYRKLLGERKARLWDDGWQAGDCELREGVQDFVPS